MIIIIIIIIIIIQLIMDKQGQWWYEQRYVLPSSQNFWCEISVDIKKIYIITFWYDNVQPAVWWRDVHQSASMDLHGTVQLLLSSAGKPCWSQQWLSHSEAIQTVATVLTMMVTIYDGVSGERAVTIPVNFLSTGILSFNNPSAQIASIFRLK
jgi:hypothetical protein